MKKHIFLFAIALLSCLQVMGQDAEYWTPVKTTEMNPFAYNLKAELSNDKQSVTIKYSLNANASSVKIVFLNGETVLKEVQSDKITKTDAYVQHTLAPISITDLPLNKKITWRVDVQGSGRQNVGIYAYDGTNTTYSFDLPSSVDIVKDPTSGNYGKVIVVEGSHAGKGKSTHSSHKGAGLYVFNPDVTPRKDKHGHFGFNGGSTTWNDETNNYFANTTYAPYRVRVSEDGRIFVSSMYQYTGGTKQQYIHGDILWEVDENFTKWTTVMGEGVGGAKYDITTVDGYYKNQLSTSGGAFIAAPNAGLDVRGKGEDLKLLMLSCDYRAFANDYNGFTLGEYNLGTAKTWNSAPSRTFDVSTKDEQVFATATTSNVVYGPDGDLWCVSYRTTSKYTEPGLVRFNSSGEEVCRIIRDKTQRAGLRFNNDYTRAIMASATIYGTLYDYMPNHGSNDSTQGYFFVERNIDMSAVGQNLNDFAWDNANNIYAVGQTTSVGGKQDGHLAVYCLPYSASDVFTTPGPNSFILAETICWHPYPAGHKVTNEDLWETFQCDYNDWYRFHPNAEEKITEAQAHQPITGAYGFTFPSDKIDENTYKYRDGLVSDLLTNEKSKWKWLGDYIKIAANPTIIPADNAALWGSSNTDVNGFMYYFNQFYGVNRATQTIANVASFWDSSGDYCNKTQGNILQAEGSAYKWLGDYILKVTNEQLAAGKLSTYKGLNTEIKWRYALYAFFNKQSIKDSDYNGYADFSEAGKPENWLPYYVSPEGKNQIDTEFEWRREVHAFFNKGNTCTYKNINGEWETANTGDYTTTGESDQANNGVNGWWDEWWDATFKPTLEAYPTDSLPTIRRKGYVLSGWYYGDNDGYSLDDRENTKGVTRNGCLWARWLETCLYEGYITGSVANSAAIEEMGKQINRNTELMNLTQSKSDYPLDVDRKMQGGMYNTFAVSFAFSKEDGAFNHINKIVAANDANNQLLSNASILCFTGTSIVENGVGEYVLQLNFDEWDGSSAILANTPILVKPENNITTRMHLQWNPYINATSNHPVTHSYVTFVPVLAPSEIQGGAGTNNFILVADNRLARLSSTGTMLGLRGYFNGSQIPDNLTPQKMIVKITEKNGVVTYLDDIDTPQQGASAIKILQNGNIYILRDGVTYTITGARVK